MHVIIGFPPSSPGPACFPIRALPYPQQTYLPTLYYLCALYYLNRSVHSGSPTLRPTLCLPTAFPCPTYNRLRFPVLMAAHCRRDLGSVHCACGSLKLSFLPCSLVIHPASYLFPNSSNRSTHKGYPTPHPNRCFSMPTLHLSNSALLLPCPLLPLCYRTCMYECS